MPSSEEGLNAVGVDSAKAQAVLKKYEEERAKRFRSDGLDQFVINPISNEYDKYFRDIWVEDTVDPGQNCLVDGSHCEVLILGAGYGGLLAAARLIQAGIDANDIRLFDCAGGFGGTWWYNRYPGLMCDVESYIYMPLLEELGYMPKHKYSYGPELRQHAENIAKHFNLQDKTLFQARALEMKWDGEWITELESTRKGHEGKLTVRSRYVILAGGTAVNPKLPKLSGLDQFKGHTFHTSRWDWKYTGGDETKPDLVNLRDKRVAIIGTGATAIQVVPELAKWAKELYVFQRTPSAVDVRGQRETDPEWWKEMKQGWQDKRRRNFSGFVNNTEVQPKIDMVDDGWTKFPSYAGLVGNESLPEDLKGYVEMLSTMDIPRQEKVRARVDEVVKNQDTAQKLKAWYPGWCKRPCFHDDYLESFNSPNVTLVDTDGRGVEKLTEKGLVFGKEYEVDCLIFSTGYEIPIGSSPAARSHMKITGKDESLDDKWKNVATLHGVMSNGFPNLFWLGLIQTGGTPNQTAMVDELALHVASIVVEANKRGAVVEPTVEGEEAWTERIVAGAGAFATMGSCPPSYFNAEGDVFRLASSSPEALKKLARGSPWSKGLYDFVREIKTWRDSNTWEGLDMKVE